MLALVAELEPRFRKSAQQQLLLETLLVRFALLDRAVELEEVLRGLAGTGRGGGAPAGGRAVLDDRARGAAAPGAEPRRTAPASDRVAAPSPRPATASATALAPERSAVRSATAVVAPGAAAPASAVAAVGSTSAAGAARATGPVPDLNAVVGRWDRIVGDLRGAGRGLLATLLAQASPVAVSGAGAVTVEPDDPTAADPLEAARDDVVAAIRAHFPGVERLLVRRPATAPEPAASRRVTHESVRTERINTLRRKDPVLGAAIDALDLELLE
jgi:DNA polymerase-3 subunit gamma/tau